VTTFSWAGRLAPAALRRPARRDAGGISPEPRPDGDLLSWLGFEPADAPDEPRFPWSRPAAWPTGRLSAA
jgi:hypothetical protein